MYTEAALNCFRYLDYKSFDEVDKLTIAQYEILMEAVRLKQFDMDYRQHLQAYLNFQVKAEKKAGKGKSRPVYRRFKQFFDYEARLNEIKGNKKGSRFSGIGEFLKKGV